MRAFVQKPKAASSNASTASRTGAAAGNRTAGSEAAQKTANPQDRQIAPPAHALNAITVHPPEARLAITRPGDASEQEAHQVAEHVMRMPLPLADLPRGDLPPGYLPPVLTPIDSKGAAWVAETPLLTDVMASCGYPLDANTREFMESRFRRNFSHVQLHSDMRAEASAKAIQARAFTVGHHVIMGAGEYAPGTPAGRALLAHELAHVVQQSTIATHGRRLIQREPSGPTYGNLFRDAPAPGSWRDVVRLKEVNGTWREVGGRHPGTASGKYDFVVKDGEIFAVKAKTTPGAFGHTEAAQGGRVSWAGEVRFNKKGQLLSWNDGSGHYRSLSSMRSPAVNAGLPSEKEIPGTSEKQKLFMQHEQTAPRPRPRDSLPQLPVEQPATKPRVPGEQPKVPAGPPRMEEFEQRFGKKAATAPATTTAALAEEAGSVLKVQGRAASALSKIGSAAGWVADFLMPGPQDAIMLMVQFAMTYAEAREAARAEGMRTGFGHGLAAGLLRLSRSWIRDNLAPKVISRSVASEVAATTGYREKGVVQGLVAGVSFAERLNADQRKALLKEATRAMRAKGDDVTLRARWERGYTAYDIIDLSVALAPRIDEILEEARKNEELRQAAEEWEKLKKYEPLLPLAPLFEQ